MKECRVNTGGWSQLESFSMTTSVISRANVYALCGEELSKDPEFVDEALRYSTDVVVAAEMVRLFPKMLAP